jgi:hypothetical protein
MAEFVSSAFDSKDIEAVTGQPSGRAEVSINVPGLDALRQVAAANTPGLVPPVSDEPAAGADLFGDVTIPDYVEPDWAKEMAQIENPVFDPEGINPGDLFFAEVAYRAEYDNIRAEDQQYRISSELIGRTYSDAESKAQAEQTLLRAYVEDKYNRQGLAGSPLIEQHMAEYIVEDALTEKGNQEIAKMLQGHRRYVDEVEKNADEEAQRRASEVVKERQEMLAYAPNIQVPGITLPESIQQQVARGIANNELLQLFDDILASDKQTKSQAFIFLKNELRNYVRTQDRTQGQQRGTKATLAKLL